MRQAPFASESLARIHGIALASLSSVPEALHAHAGPRGSTPQDFLPDAHAAITAYLDSLLGELPEEAVEAARNVIVSGDETTPQDFTRERLEGFLRSLRGSLASGQGGGTL